MHSPRFETLSIAEKSQLIREKINEIVSYLNSQGDIDLLARKLNLKTNVRKAFIQTFGKNKRNHEIINLYKNNLSLKEIAEKYNLSAENVRLILQKYDIILTHERNIKRDKIVKLVKAGYSDGYIAEKLHVSLDIIRRERMKCGLKANSATQILKDKIVTQLKMGKKPKELAEKYGYSELTINKYAQEADVFKYKVEQRDKKIIELFNAGFSRKQIAENLVISYTTVLRTIRRILGINI